MGPGDFNVLASPEIFRPKSGGEQKLFSFISTFLRVTLDISHPKYSLREMSIVLLGFAPQSCFSPVKLASLWSLLKSTDRAGEGSVCQALAVQA